MFTISAQDDKDLQTARAMIEDHLKRFAFRENFTALDWN
ncbi:DUF2218 domain-containing protein [Litorivita pollutaquae]|nr:DUF2218 domain-containing protein [Litorivita pollutaquae]